MATTCVVTKTMGSRSPDTEKSKKYDRQLRLWGDHGQVALEGAHVCLINATATGTEILKSVILPGIGAFTIIDGNKVTGEDVGNNFFLERESIGKSRAQVATKLLLELNSDVRGDFVDEMPECLLEANPSFFNKFSVVIATSLPEKTLLTLADQLWNSGVPLLVCRSYGFIGYIRLQIPEHTIIESHPDNAIDDLRLDRPFPELKEYVDSLDLNKMTKKEHSHTPFIVILFKYLEEWKSKHNGEIPKTFREKNEFKEMIRSGIRTKDEDGVQEEEENFEEAIKAVNTALKPTQVPSNVSNLFSDPCCNNLTNESKPFWFMVRALKSFVEKEGQGFLPLRGVIPDMTSDSERYIKLQNIYRSQAAKDAHAVHSHLQELLTSVGKPPDLISENDVKMFCKNAYFLRVIKGRSLRDEYNHETAKIQDITMHLDNPDSEMVFYLLLRAVDRFFTEFNRYPGYFNDQVEPDIVQLKSCLCKLLQEWGCGPLAKDDYIHEMCRYGAAELHSVAAFIGGCAAHEVIKLITGQYVPFSNTFVYNAMTQTSAVFEL